MFHAELRQRPNVARAFNLTAAQLGAQFLAPIAAGSSFEYAGHEWDGATVKLTVLEGPRLEPGQLMLGRGWANAQKFSTDVSDRIATRAQAEGQDREAVQRLQERIVGGLIGGPLALPRAVTLADDLLAGRRASERLAAAEQAVWELLHRGGVELVDGAGTPVRADQWQGVLLRWESWSPAQATTSAISLARSSSDANR